MPKLSLLIFACFQAITDSRLVEIKTFRFNIWCFNSPAMLIRAADVVCYQQLSEKSSKTEMQLTSVVFFQKLAYTRAFYSTWIRSRFNLV